MVLFEIVKVLGNLFRDVKGHTIYAKQKDVILITLQKKK
jgi:hypothetical protein